MNQGELMMQAVGCVDAGLVEEAERYTAHKKSKLCVAVLAAACISIFSAGTVLAVGWIAGNYRDYHYFYNETAPEPFTGVELTFDGYELKGAQVTYLPISSLTQDALELSEENRRKDVHKSFDSLSDAEAFYGITLPDNSVLDQMSERRCYTTMSSDGEGPTAIRFQQYYSNEFLDKKPWPNISVEAFVLTERMDNGRDRIGGCGFQNVLDITSEAYIGDGISAAIFHVQLVESNGHERDFYNAHLVVDGIEYYLQAESKPGSGDAQVELKKVIDGFAN